MANGSPCWQAWYYRLTLVGNGTAQKQMSKENKAARSWKDWEGESREKLIYFRERQENQSVIARKPQSWRNHFRGFLRNCFLPTVEWSREFPHNSIHLLKLGNNSISRVVEQRGCACCVLLLTSVLRSTDDLNTGFCFRSHQFLVSLNATHSAPRLEFLLDQSWPMGTWSPLRLTEMWKEVPLWQR